MFAVTIYFFSCNALKYVSMNNQKWKKRPERIDVISNKLLFYPYSIEVNKCIGSFNNINDPYAKLCVPEVVET